MSESVPIPGYENYTIDREGNVRNREGKILRQRSDSKGYKQIGLWDGKKQKTFLVHRLLGITFLNLKEDQFIDHINGIRDDNRLENLRVCNRSENNKNRKGTKGFFYHKTKNNEYYIAHIRINGKQISKCFPFTEEGKQKALHWRVNKEIELFKDFANKTTK